MRKIPKIVPKSHRGTNDIPRERCNSVTVKKELPPPISQLVQFDSFQPYEIGESASEVFQVTLREGSQGFLKVSSSSYVLAEIQQEISVLRWLESKLLVPKPIKYAEAEGTGYFLMTAVEGANLAHMRDSLAPAECMRLGANYLRKIHSLPISNCPFLRSLKITTALAKENLTSGLVDESDFDSVRAGWTASELYKDLLEKMPTSEDLVFTHGDYCFPNIICERNEVNGVVDLSRAGVADRHQDIALFLRSFESKTETKPDQKLFLRHYGLIDQIDEGKLEFFRLLDEFF